MLLKLGPEDVPHSPRLLQQLVLFYAFSGVLVLGSELETGFAIVNMVFDLVLMLGFGYILLWSLNRLPRFVQMSSALCGVGVVFHLLSWPLLLQLGTESADASARGTASLLMLFLISWQLLVFAHIFRRTIESSMSSAIALSFALFIISVTATQLIFSDVQ